MEGRGAGWKSFVMHFRSMPSTFLAHVRLLGTGVRMTDTLPSWHPSREAQWVRFTQADLPSSAWGPGRATQRKC